MSLIPQITLEQLKSKTASEIKALPSVEILNKNGDYIGTLVIPSMIGGGTIWGEIRTNAEYLALRANIVIPSHVIEDVGKERPVEIVAANPLACSDCEFVAKSAFGLNSHRRKHNASI